MHPRRLLALILSLCLMSFWLTACYQGPDAGERLNPSSGLESTEDGKPSQGVEPSQKGEEGLQRFSRQDFAGFDTLTQIVGYAPDQASFQEATDWIVGQIRRYDALFSGFTASAEEVNLQKLNELAGQGPVKVEPDLFNLIQLSLQIADQSDGAYNPAMDRVTTLWRQAMEDSRKNPDQAHLPDPDALAEAGKHIDYSKVKLNSQDQTVEFLDPDLRLDLGGTAKGFALELVMDQMADRGLDHYLISMGGNVKSLGSKPGGQDWTVGIRDPEDAAGVFDTLQVHDLSVVTSGIYERNFTVDGKLYHHLLDPKTLYPQERYVSLTILVEDSGIADGLSTALFNLDEAEGKKLADQYGAGIIWIYPDGTSDRYGLK